MRKLLAILYSGRIFLLFVVLELMAFVWISNSRSFQRSKVLNSSNQISGRILNQSNEIRSYLHLKEENLRLAKENARLLQLDTNFQLSLDSGTVAVNDSQFEVRYHTLQGQVINSSYLKTRNFMTLNRGVQHGIEPGMGVIASQGVVGRVEHVSQHFCTVTPLINPSFSASGRLKGSRFFGPVKWQNADYRFAHLTDIPRYAQLQKGDTVVTDAGSLLFPPGIHIGYVESYELQEDQNFFEVKLRLATDFSSLGHVYLVSDKMKMELQLLDSLQATP
mgnify:CR=1 FL=1